MTQQFISNPDYIVPVEIENQYHNVYVLKRPGVDEFLRKMGELYEIVIFTASVAKVNIFQQPSIRRSYEIEKFNTVVF